MTPSRRILVLNISVMTSEIDPEISIIKTHEWDFSVYRLALFVTFDAVLSRAQMLLRDLQELLDCCSTGKSQQMRSRMIPQDFLMDREDKDETLVIEGFVFESTSSRESLQRLCSQDGSGCHFRRAARD
ncbi:hypothetical protein D4764_10G0005360 [Takifugu flavidus]|uniref:Uncharacterized protein n=1 Tax=Takifugu flavidus TaxID=433684 RepID=A0A5C6PKU0_9TELE|nr:hypothetical protein D4764_10G0005360 [Takifugu flavidus]